MRLKIELAAMLIGLTGVGLTAVLSSAFRDFPVELTRWFRMGELGWWVLWCSFPIGVAGLVLMCVNVTTGLRKLWLLRVLGFVCFFALIPFYVGLT